jgi:uncharacterized coiled-coil DUF342 family protein
LENILKINKMKIVKEPLNVDFVVENRPLTKEEEKQISNYILSQKKKVKSVTSKKEQNI